jgi:hypothetical protein
VKLVELAERAIGILQESGDEGIRTDELAIKLDTPKRRVYDIVAILKALKQVNTKRKFDGTTVTWIDKSKDFVARDEYEEKLSELDHTKAERKQFQDEASLLKEKLRKTNAKLRRDVHAVESADKTEFSTSHLTVRALSNSGIKRVRNSGLEVTIETHEPGMLADPTEIEEDEKEELLRNLQRV